VTEPVPIIRTTQAAATTATTVHLRRLRGDRATMGGRRVPSLRCVITTVLLPDPHANCLLRLSRMRTPGRPVNESRQASRYLEIGRREVRAAGGRLRAWPPAPPDRVA